MNNNSKRNPAVVLEFLKKNPKLDAGLWIKQHVKPVLNKTFYFFSDNFWDRKNNDFVKTYKSIKELLFDKDIDFAPVLEAFGLSDAGQPAVGARSSFLDYDSMSDQELNELERELDEMTDLEYDSSSATSANSYNSSSDTDS